MLCSEKLMNAERTNSPEKNERWKPGMIVALAHTNVQYHFKSDNTGAAVVSCWDRPWDQADPAIGGHIKVCELPLGTFILVLNVSAEGTVRPSAFVLTSTGVPAFLHADDVDMTGGERPWLGKFSRQASVS
jgi:hypothetical protein